MYPFVMSLLFVLLMWIYYSVSFGAHELFEIFLTLSTFLFAIFTGFFISRQGQRFSDIKKSIATFDGLLSSVYRTFRFFGTKPQKDAGKIIRAHYATILEKRAWDYHFVHKSTTLTSLYLLSGKIMGLKQAVPGAWQGAYENIISSLQQLQMTRKAMVALHGERIPFLQWAFMYLLGIILFVSLSLIPSQFSLLGAALKSAFASSIVFIMVLLHQFDQLHFFEQTIGESSAKDIVGIIDGKK